MNKHVPCIEVKPAHSSMHGMPLVTTAATALLAQCEEFVREVPDAVYTAESQVMPGGTVGKHLRHLIDHYAAILGAIETQGVVDYDHRDRDVPMENSRDVATASLQSIAGSIARLATLSAETPLTIRVMVSGDGAQAVLVSSLGRELAFATHHAVHHQAMMKAIAGELGVEAPTHFGKAPSTLKHERAPVTRTSTLS
jgi:uncharacterized damage-inducible protein DinB